MSDTTCVRCERPMDDQAYIDHHCADRVRRALTGDDRRDDRAGLIDTTPAARDIAQGQAHTTAGDGSGSGKPESRLPFDLGATAKLDAVQQQLTQLVDRIATTRGLTRPWFAHHGDPIVTAAQWLTMHGNLEWLRHVPWGDDAYDTIEAAARIVAGIARGPATQKYLGPCGSPVEVAGFDYPTTCDGDVYVSGHAATGRCRTCDTGVTRHEREAWLDGEVRQHAYTAKDIADAYAVNVKTIRTWAARGQLRSYWRTDTGLTIEWVDPPLDDQLKGEALKERLGEISDEIQARGGRLHYVGDVLDLAAADAARRETDRSKRERRAAQRAAEEASDREAAEMGA